MIPLICKKKITANTAKNKPAKMFKKKHQRLSH